MLLAFEISVRSRGLLLDDPAVSNDLRNALELAEPFQKMDYGTRLDFYVLEVDMALAIETEEHAKRLGLSDLQRDVRIALDGAAKGERGRRADP